MKGEISQLFTSAKHKMTRINSLANDHKESINYFTCLWHIWIPINTKKSSGNATKKLERWMAFEFLKHLK